MSKIKILIVEDELIIAQDISFKLEDIGYEVIEMASSYDEAISVIDSQQIDLILLDVNLNDIKDGIDIGNYLRIEKNIPFIYLTSNADYSTVSRAKETQPEGYLIKPIQQKELFASIEMALSKPNTTNKLSDQEKHLFVSHKNALVKLNQQDILWLNAEGNYTKINTLNEKYLIRGNIKETSNKLGDQFCRIHKSYVVNVNKIEKIMANNLIIDSNEFPIGKNYKEDLLQRIKKL